jgi:hypothetical protein
MTPPNDDFSGRFDEEAKHGRGESTNAGEARDPKGTPPPDGGATGRRRVGQPQRRIDEMRNERIDAMNSTNDANKKKVREFVLIAGDADQYDDPNFLGFIPRSAETRPEGRDDLDAPDFDGDTPDPKVHPFPARDATKSRRSAGASAAQAKPSARPTIILEVGETKRIVDEIEAVLLASDLPLYKRGGLIVSPGVSRLPTWNKGKVIAQVILERPTDRLVEDAETVAHSYGARGTAILSRAICRSGLRLR